MDYPNIEQALEKMKSVNNMVNEKKRDYENRTKLSLIQAKVILPSAKKDLKTVCTKTLVWRALIFSKTEIGSSASCVHFRWRSRFYVQKSQGTRICLRHE